MKSNYWTKRTSLTSANIRQIAANQAENAYILLNSPQQALAFKHTYNFAEYIGTNKDDQGRAYWSPVADLTIQGLHMNDIGLYKITGWLQQVEQVVSEIRDKNKVQALYNNTISLHAQDGFEIGIRMDRITILTSYCFNYSGIPVPVTLQAFLKLYKAENHTFELVMRTYAGGYRHYNAANLIRSNPASKVVFGNSNSQSELNESIGASKVNPGYLSVEYLGFGL